MSIYRVPVNVAVFFVMIKVRYCGVGDCSWNMFYPHEHNSDSIYLSFTLLEFHPQVEASHHDKFESLVNLLVFIHLMADPIPCVEFGCILE